MLIDRGKLIALLLEKTDYDKEKVEQQLAELVDRISEVSEQEDFTIAGFGTFSRKDKELHFEPTEKLKTEINQKYAGMRPIELIEAYKQTGRGIPVEQESQPEATPKKPKSKRPKKTKEPEKAAAPVESSTPGQQSVNEKPKAGQRKAKKAYPAKKRTHAGAILVVLVVIIVILAGGFYLYNNSRTELARAPGVADSSSSAMTADSGHTAGMQADSMEQNASDSVSQENLPLQKSSDAIYGLKGVATSEGNNGYTIVVHSFRLKSTIEEIADTLQSEGYRTVLINANVDDSSFWRLGLGQFKTVKDARNAVAVLPEKYKAPDKHFIKHI